MCALTCHPLFCDNPRHPPSRKVIDAFCLFLFEAKERHEKDSHQFFCERYRFFLHLERLFYCATHRSVCNNPPTPPRLPAPCCRRLLLFSCVWLSPSMINRAVHPVTGRNTHVTNNRRWITMSLRSVSSSFLKHQQFYFSGAAGYSLGSIPSACCRPAFSWGGVVVSLVFGELCAGEVQFAGSSELDNTRGGNQRNSAEGKWPPRKSGVDSECICI